MSDWDGKHDRRNGGNFARELGREIVHETMEAMGFDVDHPLRVQADMAFLHRLRRRFEGAGRACFWALITLGTTGAGYAVWEGTKILIHQ